MKQSNTNHAKSLIFLLVVSSLFLAISYTPTIYEATLTKHLPPDRVMLWGEHIYTYDYNVYLSKIRQGMEGRWTVVDKYDNNPDQKGVFLQMLYLVAGKIGGLLGWGPVVTFHALRTLVSFLWILTIIYVNKFFLKKPALYIAGTLLSLLAASFPVITRSDGTLYMTHYIPWWQELDVLKRISYIPHYVINYINIAGLTLLLHLFAETEKRKYFLGMWALLFVSFFIHPSAGVGFLLSWIFYHALTTIWSKSYSTGHLRKLLKYTLVLFATALIPIVYIKTVTAGYPWQTLVEVDMRTKIAFPHRDYLLALGPILVTGTLGIILVVQRKNRTLLPVATWFLGSMASMLIFKFIPDQFELRAIQNANHVPLAILTAYLIFHIMQKTRRRLIAIMLYALIVSIFALGVVQSFFTIRWYVQFLRQRAVATFPLVPYPSQVMYPLRDVWGGIVWLAEHTKDEEVVLSMVTVGNYIPAHAGNFVYLGHNPETPRFYQRERAARRFFKGELNPEEARTFLNEQSIIYVFWGPQEKDVLVEGIEKYDFLTPVYQTFHVTIYEVK